MSFDKGKDGAFPCVFDIIGDVLVGWMFGPGIGDHAACGNHYGIIVFSGYLTDETPGFFITLTRDSACIYHIYISVIIEINQLVTCFIKLRYQ